MAIGHPSPGDVYGYKIIFNYKYAVKINLVFNTLSLSAYVSIAENKSV
ncbi:hypothetical protein BN439_1344 [Erwinia amylovora Ea644]|nr:hypothetical protein BN439_1344 [Erwinia amylovora Ea644]